MTDKPRPIAEVIVTPISTGSAYLSIIVSSADAGTWMRANAEEFGELSISVKPNCAHHFYLHVDSTYKIDEVAEYIRTMGGRLKDVPSIFIDD